MNEAQSKSTLKLIGFIEDEYVENPEMGSPNTQTGIRDLLTDLIHVCDEFKMDIYEVLERSHEVYADEAVTDLLEKTGQLD